MLPTLRGDQLRLADHAGRYLLVHFWASWMPPEPELLDQLRSLSANTSLTSDVALVGVSLDVGHDEAREFARNKVMGWPQVFAGERKTDFVRQFGIQTLPACVLIRPDGRPDPSVEFMQMDYGRQEGGMVAGASIGPPKRRFRVAPVIEALAGQMNKVRSYGGRARAAFGDSHKVLQSPSEIRVFALRYTQSGEDSDPDELQDHIRADEQMFGYGVLYDAGSPGRDVIGPLAKMLLDDTSYSDGNWRERAEVESRMLKSPGQAVCAALQFRADSGRALDIAITPYDVNINTSPADKDQGWHSLSLTPAASAAFQRQLRELLAPDSVAHRKAAADREIEWRSRGQRLKEDVDEKLAPVAALTDFRPRPGIGAIRLSWSNADRRSVLILRGDKWEAAAVPEHGKRYAQGDRIGDMEVVYSGDAAGFLDCGLTDGTRYIYKAYAVDDKTRYSAARTLGASPGKGLRVLSASHSEIQIDAASDEARAQSGALRMEGAEPNNDSLTIMIIDSPGKGTMPVKFGSPGRQIQLDARELGDAPVNGAAAYVAEFRLSSLPGRSLPAPPVAIPKPY
jgi:hypothetical protein